MDNKLFTILEVALIGGLILAVMYFGGVFDSKPAPTVVLPTSTPAPSLTSTALGSTLTATPKPTHIPWPSVEPSLTPTTPPLVQPTGLIAFETTRDGNSEIYTIQPDGTGETNLTHNPADDFAFTWSPDGSQIAFFSTRTGWLEAFVMDADGSNVTKISRLERTNTIYNPPLAWSPDGRYILAIQSSAWYIPHSEVAQALHLLRTDGSGLQATLYQSSAYIWNPGWSPDNRYLTLAIQGMQTCQVHIANIANIANSPLEFRPLTSTCSNFAWSPNGQQVAFAEGAIRFFSPDGTEQAGLEGFTDAYGYLNWSPDGLHLLYSNSNGWIDAISLDGARRVRLHLSQDEPPSWAPDGQWLAFKDSSRHDVSIANIYDPTNTIRLTSSNDNYSPQWQPQP